jgi:hypothetical protein
LPTTRQQNVNSKKAALFIIHNNSAAFLCLGVSKQYIVLRLGMITVEGLLTLSVVIVMHINASLSFLFIHIIY